MTNEGKKLEPPLKLDMGFDEALKRFALTSPKEVEENIAKAKTKKPPQDEPPRRPARSERGSSAAGRNRKPGAD
jgi:hypothetical protein